MDFVRKDFSGEDKVFLAFFRFDILPRTIQTLGCA